MTTGQSDIYGYVEEIVGAFYFSVNRLIVDGIGIIVVQ